MQHRAAAHRGPETTAAGTWRCSPTRADEIADAAGQLVNARARVHDGVRAVDNGLIDWTGFDVPRRGPSTATTYAIIAGTMGRFPSFQRTRAGKILQDLPRSLRAQLRRPAEDACTSLPIRLLLGHERTTEHRLDRLGEPRLQRQQNHVYANDMGTSRSMTSESHHRTATWTSLVRRPRCTRASDDWSRRCLPSPRTSFVQADDLTPHTVQDGMLIPTVTARSGRDQS